MSRRTAIDDKYILSLVQKYIHKYIADSDCVDMSILKQICRAEKIKLFPYTSAQSLIKALGLEQHADDTDGFCIKNVIFFDDRRPDARQCTTVAHEMGHILLGHTKECLDKKVCEMQADSFAFRLLFPDRFV